MSRRIYLATSWRNIEYPNVLALLRGAGHRVYDFRDPEGAFRWAQVGMSVRPMASEQRAILYSHPRAAQGFVRDFRALQWADTCVLLLPAGRSAHIEMGYCAGLGKHVVLFMKDGEEPDLMNLVAHDMVISNDELLEVLATTLRV